MNGYTKIADSLRASFDEQLEKVVAELPTEVRELMHEISVIVDDAPSPEIMRRLRSRRPENLCGLYTGVPITSRSVNDSIQLPAVIHLFRLGILGQSYDRRGNLSLEELRRQIRLTILHEFGHHHGLDEHELEELGY